MSAGYPAGAGQALNVASPTPRALVGDIFAFKGTYGTVWAQYVKASASIAKGQVCTWDGVSSFSVALGELAAADAIAMQAGVAQAALVTGTGTVNSGPYGWAAFRGPLPASLMATTYALSAGARYCSIDTSGKFGTIAGTVVTSNGDRIGQRFFLRITTTTVGSVASHTTDGHVVDFFLR